MNDKDLKALIEMIKAQCKDDTDKKVSSEFVCENGTVYHFETV